MLQLLSHAIFHETGLVWTANTMCSADSQFLSKGPIEASYHCVKEAIVVHQQSVYSKTENLLLTGAQDITNDC